MKPKRIMPVAIIMLLLSFTLVSTASYAWFSVNRDTKATGMTLASTGPDNLLISTDTTTWAGTVAVNNVTGHKIYPASSSNGVNFYTLKDDGNVINGSTGGVLNDFDIGSLRFVENSAPVSATEDGYYTTYTLYIKSIGTDDVNIYVADLISKSTSHETGENIDESIRIAIFNASTGNTLVGIYEAGAQNEVHPVASVTGTTATLYKVGTTITDPKATIGSTGPKITVPGKNTVLSHTYEYVTLTVKVWIEGQNHLCVNKVAGDTFLIDLKFDAVQPS